MFVSHVTVPVYVTREVDIAVLHSQTVYKLSSPIAVLFISVVIVGYSSV
jgi:hypothetical protein